MAFEPHGSSGSSAPDPARTKAPVVPTKCRVKAPDVTVSRTGSAQARARRRPGRRGGRPYRPRQEVSSDHEASMAYAGGPVLEGTRQVPVPPARRLIARLCDRAAVRPSRASSGRTRPRSTSTTGATFRRPSSPTTWRTSGPSPGTCPRARPIRPRYCPTRRHPLPARLLPSVLRRAGVPKPWSARSRGRMSARVGAGRLPGGAAGSRRTPSVAGPSRDRPAPRLRSPGTSGPGAEVGDPTVPAAGCRRPGRSRDPVDWSALARELGFADQAHLTRAFTATIGVPPAAYAREAQRG